jgi:hypothetical protein
MKTNLLRLSIVAVLAAAAAFAQSSTLHANVPFDFIVGTQVLPAGQYTVDSGSLHSTVIIRSNDCMRAAMAVLGSGLRSTATSNRGKLVFHRYGDTYYLTEIWQPGNEGHQLPETSRERELAAKLGAPPRATIAAVR